MNGLTEEQKRRYKWQTINTYIFNTILIFIFISSLVTSILYLFEMMSIMYIGLAFLFTEKLMEIIQNTYNELSLIEERIEKRIKKNKKQSDYNE